MAAQQKPARTRKGRPTSSLGVFFLGFVCALALLALGAFSYLHFAHPPASVAGPSRPTPGPALHPPPRNPRPEPPPEPNPEQPPFGISEDVYEAGARMYVKSCAACHGSPRHSSPLAVSSKPSPLQLWIGSPHSKAVGVSDRKPGDTFRNIKNGIPLSGMPAYGHLYSDTQLWQITLLLKNADQPLPDPVLQLLSLPAKLPPAP